jgi:uncharacterized protein YuzE
MSEFPKFRLPKISELLVGGAVLAGVFLSQKKDQSTAVPEQNLPEKQLPKIQNGDGVKIIQMPPQDVTDRKVKSEAKVPESIALSDSAKVNLRKLLIFINQGGRTSSLDDEKGQVYVKQNGEIITIEFINGNSSIPSQESRRLEVTKGGDILYFRSKENKKVSYYKVAGKMNGSEQEIRDVAGGLITFALDRLSGQNPEYAGAGPKNK